MMMMMLVVVVIEDYGLNTYIASRSSRTSSTFSDMIPTYNPELMAKF